MLWWFGNCRAPGVLGFQCCVWPVWVLLAPNPDWRWLLEREDSPWYARARLFRQTRQGDWDGVVSRVRESLLEFIGAAPAAR